MVESPASNVFKNYFLAHLELTSLECSSIDPTGHWTTQPPSTPLTYLTNLSAPTEIHRLMFHQFRTKAKKFSNSRFPIADMRDFFSKNNREKRRSEDFRAKNKSPTNLCFIGDFEWLMSAWITRWILDHRDFSKKPHRMPTKPPPSPMTSRFSSRGASRENLGKAVGMSARWWGA